jgi:uncharacterized protein YprB with RNaseH-like and TPR domain
MPPKVSHKSKKPKTDFGPCNSCTSFNYQLNSPQCNQGLDPTLPNTQTKSCPKFTLRWDWVLRKISAESIDNNDKIDIKFEKEANTVWIPEKAIWDPFYFVDIERIIRVIFRQPIPRLLKGKRIASVDIETTPWIPQARLGHINHITQSILDYTDDRPHLETFQIINMNRKPENVGYMLQQIWDRIGTIDIQLVFNKVFDISILNDQITKFSLEYSFAPVIIDLMRLRGSLDLVEQWIHRECGFHREQTEKGIYEEYYNHFKKEKALEPLSSYNIMDTLTPLLAYLLWTNKSN